MLTNPLCVKTAASVDTCWFLISISGLQKWQAGVPLDVKKRWVVRLLHHTNTGGSSLALGKQYSMCNIAIFLLHLKLHPPSYKIRDSSTFNQIGNKEC